MLKYRVIIWIKGQRYVPTSILYNSLFEKKEIIRAWNERMQSASIAIDVSDNKVEIIPTNRIEKMKVKFYKEEET